jgi:hypothetical protein
VPTRAATTTRRRTSARLAATALAIPLLLGTLACQPAPSTPIGAKAPAPKPPTSKPTTTTTAPVATTTTTAPPPGSSTTTTTAPPAAQPGAPLSLTDTGITRVRVEIASQAAWVHVELRDTSIEASRVVATTGDLQITGLGGNLVAGWGPGTATVDLVLRVAPGANPVLFMCKNYLAPASVSVHRRTSGDVVVGSLTNNGSSTVVPPGSCENPMSTAMSRTSLIGPVRWPARRDARPLVLANYYPWYDPDLLRHPFADPPSGPADTSSATDVSQTVDLARSSGVDGFVVEYEATPAHEPKIDLVYDAADARPGFQMAMLLDFAILDSRPLGLSPAGLDRMLDEIASHAGRPSQLEVDGRPVLFIYGATRVDPAAWSDALARLRSRTGLRPFVVADHRSIGQEGYYDYATNQLATWNQLAHWADTRTHELQLVPGVAGATGPLWVAPVSPGYDDRLLGRLPSLFVPRSAGARYEQSWDAALRSLPDWVVITSWNEYFENTHVMPGRDTGNLALTQTAARAATFHRTG